MTNKQSRTLVPIWHKGFFMLQLTGIGKRCIFASAETQIRGRYVDAGTRVKTINIKSIAKKGS
ncbi:hypothetical protein BIS30_13930 [Bacillus spizizenii]|nr:hypothetical protein BIS30_13930 [Bacillus spizizenii]EFG93578.1 hypothetical protein BSU6633_03422 [Bacillus spizizenii ATCC 6633 = JCM 2499]